MGRMRWSSIWKYNFRNNFPYIHVDFCPRHSEMHWVMGFVPWRPWDFGGCQGHMLKGVRTQIALASVLIPISLIGLWKAISNTDISLFYLLFWKPYDLVLTGIDIFHSQEKYICLRFHSIKWFLKKEYYCILGEQNAIHSLRKQRETLQRIIESPDWHQDRHCLATVCDLHWSSQQVPRSQGRRSLLFFNIFINLRSKVYTQLFPFAFISSSRSGHGVICESPLHFDNTYRLPVYKKCYNSEISLRPLNKTVIFPMPLLLLLKFSFSHTLTSQTICASFTNHTKDTDFSW